MTSLTKDKNDSTLLISKVSEFKYRDNFFKSPSDKKTNNSDYSDSSPKSRNMRYDLYGNLIKKGGKFHKVTFIDEISKKKLVEKINIVYSKEEKEIYKDIEINNYNNQNLYRNNFNDKADVNCKTCNLF
jgi:hypothetical protein